LLHTPHGHVAYEMTSSAGHPPEERNLYLTLTWFLQLLLAIGLILFLLRRDWENVFLTAVVIALTLVPAFLFRRYRVIIHGAARRQRLSGSRLR
jgi:magnesium-transporting ATPase (P-type)